MVQQVWQAHDGKVFSDEASAQDHEKALSIIPETVKEIWLIFEHMSTEDKNYYQAIISPSAVMAMADFLVMTDITSFVQQKLTENAY